ncbi:MAG: hypothetical protein R2697_06860 [Ilumatobacteraceae bacterium]
MTATRKSPSDRRKSSPTRSKTNEVGDVAICSDCSLANTAIAEQTGTRPSHPISLVARAYGIEAE